MLTEESESVVGKDITNKEVKNEESVTKKGNIDPIGTRMKAYEEAALGQKLIPKDEFMICRLDGHKFSKFTKGFKRPFDERMSRAMIRTTEDLVTKFEARTGYTESDEITLIWDIPQHETATYIFNGRIVKIASLLAGYCSARFNFHINQETFEEENLRNKIEKYEAHFDGRVFSVPSREEGLNNIIWRCLYDCRRNSISGLARWTLGHTECHKKNQKEMLKALTEVGVSWEEMPVAFRYGSFIKKELYDKETIDPKSGNNVTVKRSRISTRGLELSGFSEENVDLMFRKYWEKVEEKTIIEINETVNVIETKGNN